jgi:hypothetical protein
MDTERRRPLRLESVREIEIDCDHNEDDEAEGLHSLFSLE